ncbi:MULTISPECIES: LysR substrate-binding domain-containing protein [unclassified Modicisalibacter]|uniref:LysR family transcriptional regulator n=1 Tax=unclassified Modicisalibacter TaxID=2679913 RepID=UPI001CCA4ACD|nr:MULTISPECIES: LysR substrate-binding domain-containing protein [unclassified Modicisalibacter]MBZ9557953.1 LysR family transcriptional regulator [Modicisalibacter sp. R2A 31.J]MBZ9573379.1 LysR family transcriptional regulator [Modicisalibacter sp. MOD 31.J]
MSPFKTRALEYLDAIVHYGSLRRAAAQLGVNPSALSRQLRALEEELDTLLLVRASRVALTPAGELILRHYRDQRAAERATLSRLQALQNLERGEVRIAVGEGFIADLISAPLQNFLATYPGLEIEVRMAGLSEAMLLVKEDAVDLALLYAPPDDRQLVSHIDRCQPLDLIVPAGHALAEAPAPLSLAAIADHPLALIDGRTGMGQLVDMALYAVHLSYRPRMTTNSVSVLKNFVRSGLGVTFMPELTVLEEIHEGSIVVREVEADVLRHARARIVSQAERPLTVAAQAFIHHLRHSMRFFSADAPRVLDARALP